jgi:hypothetical protein
MRIKLELQGEVEMFLGQDFAGDIEQHMAARIPLKITIGDWSVDVMVDQMAKEYNVRHGGTITIFGSALVPVNR